jgi:hypothetical protein
VVSHLESAISEVDGAVDGEVSAAIISYQLTKERKHFTCCSAKAWEDSSRHKKLAQAYSTCRSQQYNLSFANTAS